MFSKEEARAKKTAFWEELKKEMQSIRSQSGRRINWINYPTRLKFLYVRLHADGKRAIFSIDIQPKDEGIRDIVYEQFTELKKVMEAEFKSSPEWIPEYYISNKQTIARIEWRMEGVSINSDQDRPIIIAFLKENLLAFDRFYTAFDEVVINLVK